MRNYSLWIAIVLFLLTALFTVTVRREVDQLGREIGAYERALRERRRLNDNRALERERLLSPRELRARAEELGLVASEEGADR